MKVPADFDFLAGVIWEHTHERVSASTLKRIWDYVGASIEARESTLNILSHFLNYRDWDDFRKCVNSSDGVQSGVSYAPCIHTQDLKISQKIELRWAPDRRCLIEYMGGTQYKVLQSENTAISPDDTFCCSIFVLNEAAILDRLVTNKKEPVNYIIGSESGLSQILLLD